MLWSSLGLGDLRERTDLKRWSVVLSWYVVILIETSVSRSDGRQRSCDKWIAGVERRVCR